MKEIKLTNKSIKEFQNLVDKAKEKFNKEYENRILNNIEWVDMETRESHCYNCCLFDSKKNECANFELCQRPKHNYKGFYQNKKVN